MRDCKHRKEDVVETAVKSIICVWCNRIDGLICDYWDDNRQEQCPDYESEGVIKDEPV